MSCKKRSHAHNQSGMTLIEVTVALAIFSVAALALMKSLALGGWESARLTEKLQASWIIENMLLERGHAVLTPRQPVWMVDSAWAWRASAADGEGDAARSLTVMRQDDPHSVVYQLLLSGEDEQKP